MNKLVLWSHSVVEYEERDDINNYLFIHCVGSLEYEEIDDREYRCRELNRRSAGSSDLR